MMDDDLNAKSAGRVDTHIHLLPGLDDGPSTLADALAMAEVAIADGTTHVVATSHANYQFSYVPQRVEAVRAELASQLGERLQITVGCELHLTYDNVQAALESPRTYALNHGRYLLCEFPEFFERASMTGVLDRFRALEVVPVLAHPERNPVFQEHSEVLLDYLRMGCIAQVTASSFSGRFGKRAEQFSLDLLKREWIHVVASDGHSAEKRPPRLSRAHAVISRQADAELADALCGLNPLAMLRDRSLAYTPDLAPARKKSLWARLSRG